jgi:hypothetical protein
MTDQTPKAFDFGEEPAPPPTPAQGTAGPRAFDFGEEQEAAPAQAGPPTALSFDDLPPAPDLPAKPPVRTLFDSEDHPAVRDALALALAEYPALYGQCEQRFAILFRRILPVNLPMVAEWAEKPLMEQAGLLQPVTDLVLQFTQMGVPALLESALESTKPATGVLDRLFRRAPSPAEFKPVLSASRARLLQLMADSEGAVRDLEASAQNLSLHGAVLAIVSTLASGADAALQDALVQRRTLIQQAVRQAELAILQMGQVRRQAADLIGQVSSFLTVTLPALEMAQAQRSQ